MAVRLFPIGPNGQNWTTLEDYYAGRGHCTRQRHYMSLKIGWGTWSSCVCVGLSPAGLLLSIDAPFDVFQPDSNLLVPWPQIKLLRRDCLGIGLWLYFKKARAKVWIGIGLLGGWSMLQEVERLLVSEEISPDQTERQSLES